MARFTAAGLRKKLRLEGLTASAVLFDFFIVLAGVYVAIFFDQLVEDRERAEQAQVSLYAVMDELDRDEQDIRGVLEVQAERLEAYAEIERALEHPEADAIVLNDLLRNRISPNRTFFPRRSAYSVMLASGQFMHIRDERLRLQLTDLYERDYERLVYNGEVFDEVHQVELQRAIVAHWDYKRHRLRRGQESQ